MEAIYNFFAICFGYIINAFYVVLDWLGMPYLWLCIVLFAAVTRLISLPQKISSAKKALLSPAINYDIRELRRKYGSISRNDTERLQQYKKETKGIFKKYKVSSGAGCLITLLQLPLFVGMFMVVKDPFAYIPQLSDLSVGEQALVNNFFGMSLEALPKDFGGIGIIIPLLVMCGSLLQTAPSFFNGKGKPKPAFIVILIFQALMISWMSFCFPLGVSLYWLVNDLVNVSMKKCVDFVLSRNKKIKNILAEADILIQEEKAREEAAKAQEEAEAKEKARLENKFDEREDLKEYIDKNNSTEIEPSDETKLL